MRGSVFARSEDPKARAGRLEAIQQRQLDEPIRAPFVGYIPNLNSTDVGFDGARNVRNLVELDAKLTFPPGWLTMPLASGASNGFAIGDDGSGGVTFNGAGNEQPVTLAAQVHSQDPAIAPLQAPLIITANRAGAGANEVGHFVTINSSGSLVEIPYNAAVVTASEEIQQGRDSLPDMAFAPWGGSGSPDVSGAAVVCNGHNDRVMVWDLGSGGSFPGEVNTLSRIATGGSLNQFYAESCENFADRIFFFNTVEAGSTYYNRVRWTALGVLGTNAFNLKGFGFVDLQELQEPGKRIERIGDFLACYSGDGVVFLERQPLPTSPVIRLYHSADRGLLSKFSLTAVGRDLHFGIFTDGWFFLDSQGNWTEAGQLRSGPYTHNKWKGEFFRLLDKSRTERIYTHYDARCDLLYVTFPTVGDTENVVTWIYNPKTDSVWPQNFGAICFGEINDEFNASATLGSLGTTTLGTLGTATLGSFAAPPGFRATVHGTLGGNVQLHRPNVWTREGSTPDWEYESQWVSGGDPSKERELSRVYVELDRYPSNNPTLAIEVADEDGTLDSDTAATSTGSGVETVYGDVRVLSTAHKLKLSGTHPVAIRAVSLHGYESQERSKRPEGS